ncbi:hypothetical protein [Lunatimonas salinarum]|uniref:hypothetical protein n=1 Tax=Lunatimonas salinarum TaxID=1774590 RepID=UPI001AE02CD2|nr:hypothetical protein [Lunatimonas salinarum]
MSKTIFKETQKFKDLWICLTIFLTAVVALWILAQTTLQEDLNDWQGALVAVFVLISVAVLLFVIELDVKIDERHLRFRYFPLLAERTYPLEDIESLSLIRYNSLRKFGGWGIRTNFQYWVYNTGGNHGIMVKTKKKQFLLGTQQPEAALGAIQWFNQQKLQRNAE